jgi:thiol-disulfide isomerase/thioredoxin
MVKPDIRTFFTGMTSFFLLISALIFNSCSNKDTIRITGTVKNDTTSKIFLSKIDVDTPLLIDSSDISGRKSFRFRIKASEPDYYELGFSESNFITLLAEPGEKIDIIFNNNNLYDNYVITGSKGSEMIQMLDNRLFKTRARLDSLGAVYEKAKSEPGFDVRGPEIEQEYLKILKEQRMSNIEFIMKNMTSLASIKALYQRIDDQTYVLYEPRDLQYYKIVSDSLKKYYPQSKQTRALISNFEKEMSEFRSRQLMSLTSNIPEAKLDPDLKDINGRRIVLSSLKGKYVLLTFWSAESRDCITENLQLKEYYRMFRNKGFEIYQVNLDNDENLWKTAVRFDELPWINTREENPANPEFARLFNVKTLPANFLFNPQGTVIATNLHGKNLQIKLNQLFLN